MHFFLSLSLSLSFRTQPAWVSATIGGSSKIIASTITYPYQLVKSKLQQRDSVNASTQLTERRYTGTWDCVQKVWRYVL